MDNYTKFGYTVPTGSTNIYGITPANVSHTQLLDIGTNTHPDIDAHIADSSDPHGATLTQTNLTISSALTLTSGPTLDNTQTQILARNSTTGAVVRRNNIVDTSSSQTLTNKTLTSPTIDTGMTLVFGPSPDNTQTQILARDATTGAIVRRDNIIDADASQTLYNKTYENAYLSSSVYIGLNPSVDNTQTAILARKSSDGSIVRRDNIVDTSSSQTLTGKTISSSNNTININTTNINNLINQDVRTTATPHFDALMIDSPVSTGDVDLSTNNDQKNRKIVLYQTPANPSSDHRFFGIGLQSAEFRFQVSGTNGNYNFYAATDASNSTNVFSIRGTGGIQFPNSTTGYSPTSLNYYEDTTFTANFTGAATVNGVVIRVVRIGKQVTFFIPPLTFNTSATAALGTTTDVIPSRFRPAGNYVFKSILVKNAGVLDAEPGYISISSTGYITLGRGVNGVEQFIGMGAAGKEEYTSHTVYTS